jgi:O-6-methylguanine DNA methyltransferase
MAASLNVAQVPTPIGTFRVVYHDQMLHQVDLLERGVHGSELPEGAVPVRGALPPGSPPAQLKEYFEGRRDRFDIDIDPGVGTEFDRRVWALLLKVPAGETVTYGELARRAGRPRAARAVGGAMHRNPMPIMIPCHRVVGDDRSLTGYGLGLWRKRWLLEREGAWPLKDGTAYGPRDRTQRTLDGPRSARRRGRSAPP